MKVKRNRFIYSIIIVVVILLGLSSRRYAIWLPDCIRIYSGDILWGLMIFFIFGFLFIEMKIRDIALFALLLSYTVEASQLYQSQWINSIRGTFLGGLILGYGFLWSDILCYSIGILIGVILEKTFTYKRLKNL
ncbi:MAG: DUF2809 domain-containing protein [Eubacteriaceae bacterium]